MLRLLAQGMGVGVREDVDAMVPMDRAKLAARVARQARVPSRMDVAGPYALTHPEAGLDRYFSVRRSALRDHSRNGTRNKHRRRLWRIQNRLSTLDLGACDQAALNQEFNQPCNPFLVITHPQILGRGDQLALVTRAIESPFSPGSHRQRQRERSRLPALVEHGLIVSGSDRPHAMHAAHIMHAVHE